MFLKIRNYIVFFSVIILIAFYGCRSKTAPKKYAAKVNGTYLMQSTVDKAMLNPKNKTKLREEFVHDWVETEILYKESLEEGIVSDSNYKSIIKDLKKQLAAAMLLQKVGNNNFKINEDEILSYFNSNRNDFKIPDDAVVMNYIKFNNEQSAIKVRNILLNSNWEKVISLYKQDSSVIEYSSNKYLNYYEISPPILLRYIKNLNPNEIGIVLKIGTSVYVVVQIVAFIKKGNIPSFSFIRNPVRERYLMVQRKKSLRNYINKLYSKYDVEIKKGN